MWDAVWMVRDASELDSFTAHELLGRVEDDFVRVDIAVVVRSGDRFRVKVIRAWAEAADDEPVTLESGAPRGDDASDDRSKSLMLKPRVEVPSHPMTSRDVSEMTR